ncbi:MAG: glycosyltransferase family 2 protein [Promethearchaeota archaeon]|nr:MAG: glycosyltransferase family 2 protein [Candidatus Lokiarchaeota archaeon]
MKIQRILLYGIPIVLYFVALHFLFSFIPVWMNDPIKLGIDSLFTDFFANWFKIFPFIGLVALAGLITYYGIHFLASFGKYKIKEYYYPKISVIVASKNEKPLLERTLDSIVNSNFPTENMQLVVVVSDSNDNSQEFCENFAKKHDNLDMDIISDHIPKKGKPAALNRGLKKVKNEICVFYDSGIRVESDTLATLVAPLRDNNINVAIGATLVDNWKANNWCRGAALDYTFSAGGNMFFDVKNKLGSSAYVFGRNFCIRTNLLQELGGFNEDSLTEDLYLTVLLNLRGDKILFVPDAKAYDRAPITFSAIQKQRRRWVGGYVADMPQLMEMKEGEKNGSTIIISRNLSMILLHHVDNWILIIIPLIIVFWLIGSYYLLSWMISLFVFMFGYLLNSIKKYGDGHYSLLLWLPYCAIIHFFMLRLQFTLPKEISWEKTPMILEKSEEEVEALIS